MLPKHENFKFFTYLSLFLTTFLSLNSSSSLKIYTAISRLDETKFSIKEIDLNESKYPNLLLNEIKSKKKCNYN